MYGVRVVTLNNRVLFFGKKNILTGWQSSSICIYLGVRDKEEKGYADILEYIDSEENWTKVGEMSKARIAHAVSVVNFVNFKDNCQ